MRQAEVKSVFTTTLHGGRGVSTELLQIVGQIIVDRATQAGWPILRDRAEQLLACKDKTRYLRTCKVLRDVRIQDLLASPQILLDAAVSDFAAIWRDTLKDKLEKSLPLDYVVKVSVGLGGVLTLWSGMYKDGAAGIVLERLKDSLSEAVGASCEAATTHLPFDGPSARAAWGIGMCLAQGSGGFKPRLEACPLKDTLKACYGNDPTKIDEETLVATQGLKHALLAPDPLDMVEGVTLFTTKGAAGRTRADTAADATCFRADDKEKPPEANLCAALIEDFGQLTIGLLRHDWSRFAAGAVGALRDFGEMPGNKEIAGRKFFQLLAAIGQYALTYQKKNLEDKAVDQEAATKARREIIEALVKQMTNRDDRTGWVLSVGGSVGAGVMYRREAGGDIEGWSYVALPIGLGLQHYPESKDHGFHAQVGIFDLGQYVTFEEDHETTVGTPDVKAAIALSATAGVWFGSRSVPIYVGAYGGFAPFVLANGQPEYFIGGILGAYVPLLDF
jgi:hypothetical protein